MSSAAQEFAETREILPALFVGHGSPMNAVEVPDADGAAIGKGSMSDFRLLASVVADLEGGVYLNLGSAVVLPEVFLKALNVARNLGNEVSRITTVNMDFIQHYRPRENVLKRPVQKGGTGIPITGHHEIMLPLLAAGILDKL